MNSRCLASLFGLALTLAFGGCNTFTYSEPPRAPAGYQPSQEELSAANERARLRERERREPALVSYFAENPHLTKEMQAAIRQQWFTPGMTKQDVEFSMGAPRRRITAGGVGAVTTERWFYHSVAIDFVEGVVVQWLTISR